MPNNVASRMPGAGFQDAYRAHPRVGQNDTFPFVLASLVDGAGAYPPYGMGMGMETGVGRTTEAR